MKSRKSKQKNGRWLRATVNGIKEDLGSKAELRLSVLLILGGIVALPAARALQMNTDQLVVLGTILFLAGTPLWLPLTLDLLSAAASVDRRVQIKPWGFLSLGVALVSSISLGFAHILSPALVEELTKIDAGEFGRAVTMISAWLAIALAVYGAGAACALIALAALCVFMVKVRSLSKMMAAVATLTIALTLMLLGTKMIEQETSSAFVGQELAQYNFSRGQTRCSTVDKTALVHALPDSTSIVVWEKGEFVEIPCQIAEGEKIASAARH